MRILRAVRRAAKSMTADLNGTREARQ